MISVFLRGIMYASHHKTSSSVERIAQHTQPTRSMAIKFAIPVWQRGYLERNIYGLRSVARISQPSVCSGTDQIEIIAIMSRWTWLVHPSFTTARRCLFDGWSTGAQKATSWHRTLHEAAEDLLYRHEHKDLLQKHTSKARVTIKTTVDLLKDASLIITG